MPFDDNKLYCSEVLSILLQNHEGKLLFREIIHRFYSFNNTGLLALFVYEMFYMFKCS